MLGELTFGVVLAVELLVAVLLGGGALMVVGPPGRSVESISKSGPLAPSGVLNSRLRFHQQGVLEVKLKYTGWVPLNGAEGSCAKTESWGLVSMFRSRQEGEV